MTPQTMPEPRTHNDYTVGWVCALPKELIAAAAMLDETHLDLPRQPNDHNAYTLGRVGGHNVVVACLPKGEIGNNSSATVAARMTLTFPSIRFGLMVGVGGGVPKSVRLGDVVVSTPTDGFGGVVQWDFGKTEQGGTFKRTGALNRPPAELLAALTKLEKEYNMKGSKIPQYLEELKKNWPKLASKYTRSESLKDVLFRADCKHIEKPVVCNMGNPDNSFENIEGEDDDRTEDEEEESHCINCDQSKIVRRKPRDMCVHYGLIASSNQVIKDAAFRDEINKRLGGKVLCFEMEAAGLMNDFPCIVIRGICDYADSHKNKDWQEYAAAVAAAFAKELLSVVPAQEVQQMPTIKNALQEILTGLKKVLSRQLDQEQQAILEWLTPIDYAPQQSDIINRRQEGTGLWLLTSEEFQNWVNQGKKTLFCPGIPGAGKTMMSSIVVDHLSAKFGNDAGVGIAYIYCNYQPQQEQMPADLLLSLLKQLAQGQPAMPTDVKNLYEHYRSKGARPSFDEIVRVLHSTIQLYSRVFIIIDALDEYHASNKKGLNRLLSGVFGLQDQGQLNLFATSRSVSEITSQFEGCILKEIRAQDDDVLRYVNGRINELLRSQISKHLQVQDTVRRGIVKAADGMFLLARLHMDSLMSLPTVGDIKQALRNLPQGMEGLNKTYEQAIKRIEGQEKGYQELAKRVLAWVFRAKRALYTVEVQHALAVKVGMMELDEDFLPEVEILGSVCAGLVTIDKKSDVIRLVHYTTQEYFEQTSSFPNAETDITATCVTYLSFDTFATKFCLTDEQFEARLKSYRLYDYAARNWGHHARATSAVEQLVVDFLKNKVKASSSSQAMMASGGYSGYSQEVPKQMIGVHLAAYFGLKEAMVALLKNGYDLDSKDTYGRTPLLYAAWSGREAVVKLLLEKGAELETKSSSGQTPLSYAAWSGREAVVKLLLEKGAEQETKDGSGWTPLSYAAGSRYEAVVKLLLEKGAQNHNSS